MPDTLKELEHRPWPLPKNGWRMKQYWRDLLFAHWPIPAEEIQPTLPDGLEVDTYDGSGWLGVVPFRMTGIRLRAAGAPLAIPGATSFPEMNLRTYVRSRKTGQAGVYFYSLEASSAIAVAVARMWFKLPYYWATMHTKTTPDGVIQYRSHRILNHWKTGSAHVQVKYKQLEKMANSAAGSVEHFLTERYALFTQRGNGLAIGNIHHKPWPLHKAEAEFVHNKLPAAYGFKLPEIAPLLHFAPELKVYIWPLATL